MFLCVKKHALPPILKHSLPLHTMPPLPSVLRLMTVLPQLTPIQKRSLRKLTQRRAAVQRRAEDITSGILQCAEHPVLPAQPRPEHGQREDEELENKITEKPRVAAAGGACRHGAWVEGENGDVAEAGVAVEAALESVTVMD